MKATAVRAGVLFALTLALYGYRLDYSPVYLTHDEVVFGLNAQTLASTGHDEHGRFLPLYFQILVDYWAQPLLIYVTSLFLTVLPLSEAAIRLPSAVIGAGNVVLTYFICLRIFKREWLALLAAVLLALTPAHFIHSRLAMDYLYPTLFIQIWLLCTLRYLENRRLALLFFATFSLGIGFYSYIAAIALMPLFFLLTCLILVASERRQARPYLAAAAGFALPLLPAIGWVLRHPEVYASQVRRYKLYDPDALNALQGTREFLNFTSVTDRVSVYWSFFDPSFLFFSGGSNYVNATRAAGVFLIPLALLLAAGMWRLLRSEVNPIRLAVVIGFFLSAAAAPIVPEPYAIDRALGMVTFGVLIATFGVEHLLSRPQRIWRFLAIVMLCAVPLQFAWFVSDYFGGYRLRSLFWFERNIRGAAHEIMTRDRSAPLPMVCLSTDIPWIDAYWTFYTRKEARTDLLPRTRYAAIKTLDLDTLPKGSLLVANSNDEAAVTLGKAGRLQAAGDILEPDGTSSFSLWQKP